MRNIGGQNMNLTLTERLRACNNLAEMELEFKKFIKEENSKDMSSMAVEGFEEVAKQILQSLISMKNSLSAISLKTVNVQEKKQLIRLNIDLMEQLVTINEILNAED
jgi:hypothetical protein